MLYYEIQNLYLEHIKPNDLKNRLSVFDFYAFILHDKDVKSTGELKKEHYHLIVGVELDSRHAKQYCVERVLEIYDKCRVNTIRCLSNSVNYLIHKKDKNKYQYNFDEIVTNDLELVDELINNYIPKMSDTEMILQEFVDYVLENSFNLKYIDIVKWWRSKQKLSYYINHERNIFSMVESLKNQYINDSLDKEINNDVKAIDKLLKDLNIN